MSYIKILFKAITSPKEALNQLADSKKSIKYGWLTVVGFALFYTLTVYSFHVKSLVPLLKYLLPVSKSQYYYYQSFITAPVTIAGVMINYQVINFFLKRNTIIFDYKQLWGPISIASILPAFFILWFVETILIVTLDWNHFTFDIIRITFGILWTIFLTVRSVQVVKGIKKNQSIVIGFVSSVLMMLWWGLFFR